jgi:hypothetical protein
LRSRAQRRATSVLDFFLIYRFFVTLPTVEYFLDEFQNIDARVTPAVGVGYEAVKGKIVDWEVTLGGAYQYTRYSSVSSGSRSANDGAAYFGTTLELDFPNDIDFTSDYRLQLVATDLGKTSHHWLSTLSFEIWGPLDLDLSFTWDRVQDPQRDSDGDLPESDDFRYSVGLGLDF